MKNPEVQGYVFFYGNCYAEKGSILERVECDQFHNRTYSVSTAKSGIEEKSTIASASKPSLLVVRGD